MGSEVIILPVIFGVIFAIAYLYFSTRNKERLALIEKGADASIFVRGKAGCRRSFLESCHFEHCLVAHRYRNGHLCSVHIGVQLWSRRGSSLSRYHLLVGRLLGFWLVLQ